MGAYVLLCSVIVCFGLARTVHGECPRPTGGANMMLSGSHTFPVQDGTMVSFTCETGYKPQGSSGSITCTSGSWSDLKMSCEIRNCGSAGEVNNGRVDYTEGTDFGAIVRAVCNTGYYVVGFANRLVCGVQGWEGRLGECEVVTCQLPSPIENGYFSPNKDTFEYSEVATFSCDRDYILKGSKTLSCTADRVFDSAPPTCVLVNCLSPNVTNGRVVVGRPPYKHMSSVTLRCNLGHTLKGSDQVSCSVDSEWVPALPTCQPSVCKTPEIENGQIVDGPSTSYKYSETVTLKCDTGFTLSGQSTLTCGTNDEWSAALPKCTEIQCKTPEVKDGVLVGDPRPMYKYSESVTFECKTGYKLTGQNTLKCDYNSQWSPQLPECTPIECKAPEVKNGQLVLGSRPSYKYLDSVKFECNAGYKMNGASSLRCEQNRQWSPELPECTPIECKAPEVKNGQLVLGSRPSYKYLDSVKFECNAGYKMNGASSLRCEQNRQWSPELPECTRNNGHVIKVVLSVVGAVCGFSLIGCCIYFGFLKKKRGDGKLYTEAPQDTPRDNLALS